MRRASAGFTLVELMVTVAILGLLSAVAIGAYNDYIHAAMASRVTAHYRVAADEVRFSYENAHIQKSQGRPPAPPIQATSTEWVVRIAFEAPPAPGGGPAFVVGAGDAATGAIGVASTGAWATSDSQVIITRPAFGGLTTESVTISQQL